MTTASDRSILRTVPLMLTVAPLCPLAYGKDMAPGTLWEGVIDDVRIYNRAVRP